MAIEELYISAVLALLHATCFPFGGYYTTDELKNSFPMESAPLMLVIYNGGTCTRG